MSDVMAIEQMAKDLASLDGYHTKTRVPYLKEDRDQDSASDIDVLGVDGEENVLAVECKAVGSPTGYQNWNRKDRVSEIRDEVSDLATNIDQILDPEYERVNEVDMVWFVFKGYFATDRSNGTSVVKENIGEFEQQLEGDFDISVELKPIHILIQDLIDAVSEDMITRRKRYASPTMELLRQLSAIADNRPGEIDAITKRLLETPDTKDR